MTYIFFIIIINIIVNSIFEKYFLLLFVFFPWFRFCFCYHIMCISSLWSFVFNVRSYLFSLRCFIYFLLLLLFFFFLTIFFKLNYLRYGTTYFYELSQKIQNIIHLYHVLFWWCCLFFLGGGHFLIIRCHLIQAWSSVTFGPLKQHFENCIKKIIKLKYLQLFHQNTRMILNLQYFFL